MKWLALMLLLFAANLGSEEAVELTVTVEGLRPGVGQVALAVFDDEDAWLRDSVFETTLPVSGEDSVRTVISLPPGTYAASSYYDLDSDGKMDTNFMRIPKEPVGFSNDAKASFGPARFDDAAFALEADLDITIRLTRVRGN